MNTMTIPLKEYRQSIQMQKTILYRLDLLQKAVVENSKDEVSSEYIKRLEKISLNLDAGKGKKFSSTSSFRNYLRDL